MSDSIWYKVCKNNKEDLERNWSGIKKISRGDKETSGQGEERSRRMEKRR